MKIYEPNNFKELSELVDKLRVNSPKTEFKTNDKVEFGGFNVGRENIDSKYLDWINDHHTVLYQGQLLDFAFPSATGKLVLKFRPFLEKIYNNKFILTNNRINAYAQNISLTKILNNKIKTLTPITQLNDKFPETFISLKQEDLKPLVKLIDEYEMQGLKSQVIDLTKQKFELLAKIHETGVIWCDASDVSMSMDKKGDIIPFNFYLKSNYELNQELKQAKDFKTMIYSTVNRTTLSFEEIINAALEGYLANREMKKAIKFESKRKLPITGNKFFFKPVYGVNKNQIKEINLAILDKLYKK